MGTKERRTASKASYVSLETEIPEVLYRGMKDFIGEHPSWDQYRVMSSALAHFLFQNGCDDRAVTERYLDDLFIRPCLLYTSPSPRDYAASRMPSSA